MPRRERPYWVAQQLEVAVRVGLGPRLEWFWGRHVWHRSRLQSGVALHREHPTTFWVPEQEIKDNLRPGDKVKLVWMVRRSHGERMWVTITDRRGDRMVGCLENEAVFAYLDYGETVKFHVDNVIDYVLAEEMEQDVA